MSPETEVLLFYNLCRNVPYFYDTFMWPFSAPVSPLTSRFPLIMVVSGFGPYHCQQLDDVPAKCAGITPTPWAIMPTLGFVSYCRGHELLVTHNVCRFCFLGETILHDTMNVGGKRVTNKEIEIWDQSLTKDRRVKHRPTKNVGEQVTNQVS